MECRERIERPSVRTAQLQGAWMPPAWMLASIPSCQLQLQFERFTLSFTNNSRSYACSPVSRRGILEDGSDPRSGGIRRLVEGEVPVSPDIKQTADVVPLRVRG